MNAPRIRAGVALARPQGDAAGFTLLELLVAMGILVFGITALLGVMSVGVDKRRGAEMRSRAVLLADHALHRIETDVLANHPIPDDWLDQQDLAVPEFVVEEVDGYPGMKYSVRFDVDPEMPEVVLARVRVSWLDQGDDVAQEFLRVLPREVPLTRRVAERRKQS